MGVCLLDFALRLDSLDRLAVKESNWYGLDCSSGDSELNSAARASSSVNKALSSVVKE